MIFFLYQLGFEPGTSQLLAHTIIERSGVRIPVEQRYFLRPKNWQFSLLCTGIDGTKVFISQSLASHKAATPMGACQSVPAVTSPILWTDCKSFFRFKSFSSLALVSWIFSCLRMLLYIRIIYLVLNLAYQWASFCLYVPVFIWCSTTTEFFHRSGYFCDPSLGVWQLPRINEYSWIFRFSSKQ